MFVDIQQTHCNFVNIQASHVMACDGYTQSPFRTGYETVLAHRTEDLYAMTAKQDGVVTAMTKTGITVQYAGGATTSYKLGREFGASSGLTIPHEIITDFKVGTAFKRGEPICYNPGFFERDVLKPDQLVWKAGALAMVALIEDPLTLEDASSITPSLARKLETRTSKPKDIIVRFDQVIHRLIRVQQVIESDDPLCVIEDHVTANAGLFDQSQLMTLQNLAAQAPTAKVNGVVERIEVFYNGDPDEMSESVAQIAHTGDMERIRLRKSRGMKPMTGAVDDGFRVSGKALEMDTMLIRVYVTQQHSTGLGDKLVFANQMKTTISKVLVEGITTQSGVAIDAIFGAKSIHDRIVTSPFLIGTTNRNMLEISKQAAGIYFKLKK